MGGGGDIGNLKDTSVELESSVDAIIKYSDSVSLSERKELIDMTSSTVPRNSPSSSDSSGRLDRPRLRASWSIHRRSFLVPFEYFAALSFSNTSRARNVVSFLREEIDYAGCGFFCDVKLLIPTH